MLKFLKVTKTPIETPKFTVEDIHREIDSAENLFLESVDSILMELKIPTQSHIEKKANILMELGFVKSETVKKAETLKKNADSIKAQYEMTEAKAKKIREYKIEYPLEKFIPLEEIVRICKKYGLVYAPVGNYIKDVPEKNVLEIQRAKKLYPRDKPRPIYTFKILDFYRNLPSELVKILSGDIIIPEKYYHSGYTKPKITDSLALFIARDLGYNGDFSGYIYTDAIVKEQTREGLLIAAPRSHFDFEGMENINTYEYAKTNIIEILDPVVFEICNGDICRIITKWGTDDDQSYLDPTLTNEIQN